jgi:hypothetical protein
MPALCGISQNAATQRFGKKALDTISHAHRVILAVVFTNRPQSDDDARRTVPISVYGCDAHRLPRLVRSARSDRRDRRW